MRLNLDQIWACDNFPAWFDGSGKSLGFAREKNHVVILALTRVDAGNGRGTEPEKSSARELGWRNEKPFQRRGIHPSRPNAVQLTLRLQGGPVSEAMGP